MDVRYNELLAKMDAETVTQMFADHDALWTKISSIHSSQIRSDLIHMSRACESLREQISKESVICRQRKHPTIKYLEYLEQFRSALDTLSEYTTLALLMDH